MVHNPSILKISNSWYKHFFMNDISRKKFLEYTASAGAAALLSSLHGLAMERGDKKLKGKGHEPDHRQTFLQIKS